MKFRPLLLFLLLNSCATGSKHLVAIDLALTDIQNGRAEQGRAALEKLCEEGGATGSCALTGRKVQLIKPLSILQGVTSGSQTRFVVIAPHQEKLRYFARSGERIMKLNSERAGNSSVAIDHVEAFGLEPKVNYDLIVLGSDGMAWDKRGFRALDLSRRRARAAVVSGLDDSYSNEQIKMWAQLASQHPDVIFMAGDTVFPEKGDSFTSAATPEVLWRRHRETRENLWLFKLPNLIPVLAVWNDHDYGRSDGDRTYANKSQAAEIFETFFAQKKPAPGFEPGPGVAFWWQAFGVNFAFLDNRSFRSPNGLDVADQTHFGEDQEVWLKDHLKSAHAPAVLISGDPFFGGSPAAGESYEANHPKKFAVQLEEWRKDPEPMLFVSGGRRFSEILYVPPARLGYPTYQLTSGGMHAKVGREVPAKNPGPNRMVGADGQMNYMIVELIRSGHNFLQLDVQAFGPDKKQLYQRPLTVKRQ